MRRIPKSIYTDEQWRLLESKGIIVDFSKEYSVDEIVEIEDEVMDSFVDTKPTEETYIWEKIIDIFLDEVDN